MFEQRGVFVRRGTALRPLLQRWNVALVCAIGVFPSTEASLGCHSLANVSEKLDTFRAPRHS